MLYLTNETQMLLIVNITIFPNKKKKVNVAVYL